MSSPCFSDKNLELLFTIRKFIFEFYFAVTELFFALTAKYQKIRGRLDGKYIRGVVGDSVFKKVGKT